MTNRISVKSRQHIEREARIVAEKVVRLHAKRKAGHDATGQRQGSADDSRITSDFLAGLLSAFAERCIETVTAEFERGINS